MTLIWKYQIFLKPCLGSCPHEPASLPTSKACLESVAAPPVVADGDWVLKSPC